MLTIELTDQIPSGKNAIKERYVNGRKIRYPNKRFVSWRSLAGHEVLVQRSKMPFVVKGSLPLTGPLKLTVYYRELEPVPANGTRDASGMLDALQHLLEYCDIIQNDGQIKEVAWRQATRGPCIIIQLEGVT